MTQDHEENSTEYDSPRPPSWISMGVSLLIDHSAFVALLVIGGGIAALMAVPAIQNAREAARRAQCKSGLKRIGLGLHNYHQAVPQTLPMPEVPAPLDEPSPQTRPTP